MITNYYNLQRQMLPGVSRTFALTIPQLAKPLATIVTNAYLLCRIADTIEDDINLNQIEKTDFYEQFYKVLSSSMDAENFAQELLKKLDKNILSAERELIKNIPIVIKCLRSFTATQQASICRCVNIMLTGMLKFQNNASLSGLNTIYDLDKYCYFVAGIVGEMLTELFCDYSEIIASKKEQLMLLSVSFGQGLQMTNILKDFWEDRSRGVCWLPQDICYEEGIDLVTWDPTKEMAKFNRVLIKLIKKTQMHLQDAVNYVLLIPANEIGIRRFTLWAIGLAVLTLRNLHNARNFTCDAAVKVSRNELKIAIFILNSSCKHNKLLQYLFTVFSRKLI